MLTELTDYTQKEEIYIYNKSLLKEYRMKLWSEALLSMIKERSINPTPTEIADAALAQFDKRFK